MNKNSPERWAFIKEYGKEYLVSDRGKIMDKHGTRISWRFFKDKTTGANTYPYVSLCKRRNGEEIWKRRSIHLEVAKAFVPNPKGHLIVNHKDLDKANPCWWNLEWCDHKYNMKHQLELRHKLGLRVIKKYLKGGIVPDNYDPKKHVPKTQTRKKKTNAPIKKKSSPTRKRK